MSKTLVAIGDEVDVKIIKIDEKGRVDASMKALLPRPPKAENSEEKGEKTHRHATVLVTTIKTTNLKKTLLLHKKIQNNH